MNHRLAAQLPHCLLTSPLDAVCKKKLISLSVNTIYLKNILVEDKKYFGKKCLVVLDSNNLVQLIDFDGNIIKEVYSVEYQGINRLYAKFFIEQSLNK